MAAIVAPAAILAVPMDVKTILHDVVEKVIKQLPETAKQSAQNKPKQAARNKPKQAAKEPKKAAKGAKKAMDEPANHVLKSQVNAYEKEILNLQMEKALVEADLVESQDALERIKGTTRMSDDTSEILKTENQTLKLTIKEHGNSMKTMKRRCEALLAENNLKKAQLVDLRNATEEAQLHREESKKTLTKITKEHAMDLGRLKREHDSIFETEKQCAMKRQQTTESNMRAQKNDMQGAINELKDTVTTQALRLTAYENQINRLDEENMQLRVQNEIVKQNRITSSEQTEIEELRQTARTQEESIQRLSSQINLIRVNQHQDYRAGSGRLVGN